MDCKPKIRQLSKKEKKYVDLAKRISYQSGYSHRHGAVLIKGASIINVSCNKNKFSSFATRFTKKEKEFVTVHAELGSILNVERTHTEGATVYVVRVNNQDELRLSKPCPMCEEAMRFVGIKKVVYSTSEGTFEEVKL